MIYCYVDETKFGFPENRNRFVGAGLFFCKEPISEKVIKSAFSSLADKARKSDGLDSKCAEETLDRGFFHAREDADLAKIALAESIVKHVKGHFRACFCDQESLRAEQGQNFKANIKYRQAQMLEFSMLPIQDEILIILDNAAPKRVGDKKWREMIYELNESQIINTSPVIPIHFPKIEVEVRDRIEPGLQVVDHLLWSSQRSFTAEEISPLDNYPLAVSTEGGFAHFTWYEFKNGEGIKTKNQLRPLFSKVGWADHKSLIETQGFDIAGCYKVIDDFIEKYSDDNCLPAHAAHFRGKLKSLVIDWKSDEVRSDRKLIMRACSLFLRLFDTIPIWKDFDIEDVDTWKIHFEAKYISSLIIQPKFLYGVRMCSQMNKYRYNILSA